MKIHAGGDDKLWIQFAPPKRYSNACNIWYMYIYMYRASNLSPNLFVLYIPYFSSLFRMSIAIHYTTFMKRGGAGCFQIRNSAIFIHKSSCISIKLQINPYTWRHCMYICIYVYMYGTSIIRVLLHRLCTGLHAIFCAEKSVLKNNCDRKSNLVHLCNISLVSRLSEAMLGMVSVEVGQASSNITKMSHAPTYSVLNIWQLAILYRPCTPISREGCHWERTR